MELKITRLDNPTQHVEAPDHFGTVMGDHMFVMHYKDGIGWHDAEIKPYENLSLSPAAQILHYGQAIFEGMKAYENNGEIQLFRPNENFERLNRSAKRIAMPTVDVDFMVDALKQLVDIDRAFVPTEEGQALYIRPFMIATEPQVGLDVSHEYQMIIITSPVKSYFSGGLKPIDIYVEQQYVRAVRGGTGFAKVAGNYAGSLIGQQKAADKGCSQAMWLDGVERKYIEEVGSMNIFFKIDGKIITPKLNGSVLPGITRKSVIEILQDQGYTVEERPISIDEVIEAHEKGTLEEIFGTGTAVVIASVGKLVFEDDKEIIVNDKQTGELTQDIYDTLTGIQFGDINDERCHHWIENI